ncbi:MAG: NAD(P)H-hydrate dehydratase [Spirochaetia bacterium]|nr:NAD(P)H-hydrate dehydratase [Spirochaetia bacterium]
MRPLVGFAQSLRIDRTTKDTYALSDDLLMEAAAIGMAHILFNDDSLRRSLDAGEPPALAICGGGNNGGDALALLRRLAFSGRRGLVALVPTRLGDTCAHRLSEATRAGVTMLAPDDSRVNDAIREAGIVIDGAAGVGFKGGLRPELARLIGLMRHAPCPVVAIDVPSGLGSLPDPGLEPEQAVCASVSLCVDPLKAELYYQGNRSNAGRIIPVSGVFPVSAGRDSSVSLLEPDDLGSHLPFLDPDCHKGQRGALGVFAGCPGSTGAAVLCSKAASAAGAGSVTLLVQDQIVPILSSLLVSQMVRSATQPGTRRFDAIVAGPGWGINGANERRLDELWDSALPLVLDADALRLLAASPREPRCSPLMLTPHPGEFASLAAIAGGADPRDALSFAAACSVAARRARYDTSAVLADTARHFAAVIVLKGSVTWIGEPDGRMAVWDGRDPGLACAGSGDVLAGLAGGFMARGASAWDAAIAAVISHALAGRALAFKGFYEAGDLLAPVAALASKRSLDGNEG